MTLQKFLSSTNLIGKIRRGSSPVDQTFISVDEDVCEINKGWVPTNHDYSIMPQKLLRMKCSVNPSGRMDE